MIRGSSWQTSQYQNTKGAIMRKNLNNDQIVGAALRGEDAVTKSGNMSTDAYRVGFGRLIPYQGQLPKPWVSVLGEAFRAGRVSQVIYSYSTPIAWLDRDYGWIIPRVTYSVTTSVKHQSQLYRLNGRHISAPWDATAEDMRRVLTGELSFTYKGYGSNRVFTGTVPGPNYQGA